MIINLEPTLSINIFHAKVNGNYIGDIYREIDGFYYYEPVNQSTGCYSEELLAALLLQLQTLNSSWKEKTQQYFKDAGKKDLI